MRSLVVKASYLAAAAISVASLAGCATSQTFSQITGKRWTRTELNTFDVIIISVDGTSFIEREVPINIDPGPRSIVVQSVPTGSAAVREQRTLKLDVEPCTRYWLEAKKQSPLAADFEPRVNFKEAIAGCGVKRQG